MNTVDLPKPPQSIEAEQHVIGGLLQAPDRLDALEFLAARHFYAEQNRIVYTCIKALAEAGQPVDVLLVAEALQARGELDRAGGQAYLGNLAVSIPSAANIKRYAEIVRDRSILRELQARALAVIEQAATPGADPRVLADHAEASFLQILDTGQSTDTVPYSVAVAEAVEAREAPALAAIGTGLVNLDRLLSGRGFKPGQLAIIAARPAMGKSALAGNIAERVSERQTVAVFTLEMTRREWADRSLNYHASLIGRDAAALHLMKLRTHIDHTPALSVGQIRSRCRRIKRTHGLALIVVDYLQLMTGQGENRTQEIGSISRGLKALAKEMQAPVIAVAQINRGVEQRQDKRPLLSDLRESGDIEADADIVLMVYRDDIYSVESPSRGLAEVIVRKQRNGPTGTAWLRFDPALTRFHDYSGPIPQAARSRRTGMVSTVDFKMAAAGRDD